MVNKGEIYRHYKHDPNGPEHNYTYEIIGVGFDTEQQEEVVIYKPLYPCEHDLFVRPLSNFCETVEIDGKQIQRFTEIKKAEN